MKIEDQTFGDLYAIMKFCESEIKAVPKRAAIQRKPTDSMPYVNVMVAASVELNKRIKLLDEFSELKENP